MKKTKKELKSITSNEEAMEVLREIERNFSKKEWNAMLLKGSPRFNRLLKSALEKIRNLKTHLSATPKQEHKNEALSPFNDIDLTIHNATYELAEKRMKRLQAYLSDSLGRLLEFTTKGTALNVLRVEDPESGTSHLRVYTFREKQLKMKTLYPANRDEFQSDLKNPSLGEAIWELHKASLCFEKLAQAIFEETILTDRVLSQKSSIKELRALMYTHIVDAMEKLPHGLAKKQNDNPRTPEAKKRDNLIKINFGQETAPSVKSIKSDLETKI